jgi:putative ABC transport system permease protein
MTTIRFALRQLLRSPGFSAIAVITLALGIGLNAAMFSVLNTFLLRPLSFAEPDRLFRLHRFSVQTPEGSHRAPNYLEIERQSRQVADLAGYGFWGFTLTEPGHAAVMGNSLRVSANFLDVLRIQPAMGRTFRPEEDAVGRNRVIILSDVFWRSRYGADPSILGRVVKLDDEAVEVVGVLPPNEGMRMLFGVDFLRPLALNEEERSFRSETLFQILGRYRPVVTPAAAQAHFDVVAGRLVADRPQENSALALRTAPLQSMRLDSTSRMITYLLLGLSGFVLLIACANLANLLIARAMERSREFAMRAALGASPAQLVRPLAAECLLLVALGAAASVPLSMWTTEWLGRQLAGDGPPLVFVHDWRVLGFAIAAAFVTALLVGVAPGWLISHVNVNDTLKSGARGSTVDPTHHRFRNALIVGQVALTLVLLAGAAAFARGINHLVAREAGWTPGPLVSGRIGLRGYDNQQDTYRFWRLLRDRLAALPGVERASVDIDLPLYGFMPGQRAYIVEGRERPTPGQEPTAMTNMVSPEYFDTVGTSILRGRGVLPTDTHDSPRVVVINDTMARTLFPRGNAIGHRLGRIDKDDAEWAEIVGIARDVRFLNIAASPTAFQVYKALSQETWAFATATVRAADGASPAGLVEPFRRAVAELAPDTPVLGLMPVSTAIRRSNQGLVTINRLLFAFAGLGLFVAGLGLYGVVMRLVAQRTMEIGIRVALGARFEHVMRLVLNDSARTTLIGVGLGLVGALALTRFLNSELPGLATGSALTISAAAALLLAVSTLACYLPARRAAKVDPLVAIRAE